MNIISRKEAKALGQQKYFTGKTCVHGHTSPRWTSNWQCIECCETIHKETDRNNYRYGNTFERQYGNRRQVAKRRGIPFTVKFDEIEQPTHCPIFGVELNYGWSGPNRRDPNKATFDKLIPELGYVPGNVFVISWRANKLKSDMSLVELEKIMKYIKENTL